MSGEHISREAATTIIERLRDKSGNDEMAFALNWASRLIRDTPAADVVEIVRCRDCKHRIVNENYGKRGYLKLKAMCELDTGDPFAFGRDAGNEDWFCADGKRKEGGPDT